MKKLALLFFVVAFIVGFVAAPAGAGFVGKGAVTEKIYDFYTTALQGDGTIQNVYCSQASRVVKPDGTAVEEYQCELIEYFEPRPPGMGLNYGQIVYPKKAVRFQDTTGWGYFSDFLFFTSDYNDVCFADTWREQLTPSGQVHFKADYGADPPCRN